MIVYLYVFLEPWQAYRQYSDYLQETRFNQPFISSCYDVSVWLSCLKVVSSKFILNGHWKIEFSKSVITTNFLLLIYYSQWLNQVMKLPLFLTVMWLIYASFYRRDCAKSMRSSLVGFYCLSECHIIKIGWKSAEIGAVLRFRCLSVYRFWLSILEKNITVKINDVNIKVRC